MKDDNWFCTFPIPTKKPETTTMEINQIIEIKDDDWFCTKPKTNQRKSRTQKTAQGVKNLYDRILHRNMQNDFMAYYTL